MGFDELGKVNGYWLGGPATFSSGGIDPEPDAGDEVADPTVYRRALREGGELSVTEAGVVMIDFTGLDRVPTQAQLDKAPFDNPKYKASSIVGPRRVELLNAHQLCLISAIGFRGDEDDLWYQEPRPVSIPTLIQVSHGHRWRRVGVMGSKDYDAFLERKSRMFRTPVTVLDAAVDSFERLLTVERAARACHGLLHALDHYSHWRVDQALIMAWTTCEVMLDSMWEAHFTMAATRAGHKLNSPRRAKLKGQEFTSSIVLESLALAGLVGQELYDQLTRARAARNKWAHALDPVTPSAASDAILSGLHLVENVTGVDLDVPVIHSAPTLL
jgi:hypothetical protein